MSEGRSSDDEVWADAMRDVPRLPGRDKRRVQTATKHPKPSTRSLTVAGVKSVAEPLGRTPSVGPGALPAPLAKEDKPTAEQDTPGAQSRSLQADHDALRAQHAALQAQVAALRAELDAARTMLAALQADHLALRQERAAPPPPSEPTPRPLAQAGLSDAQLVATLDRLLAADRKLCARALLRDGDASAWHMIDDRVVLACALCSARLRPGVVAVEGVTAADCDLCGGSDTRRAFADLVAACEVAQVGRVLILGGSPPYREEAQRLVKEATRPLKIDFVGEGSKPGTKKALANARGADVLVVWCSTLLDHATTDAFGKADALRVVVNRRGIGSMFAQVAEALMSRSGST